MCGATDDQKKISDSQQQMYKELNDNYTKMFGQQQELLGSLTSAFLPIVQAGPAQAGYSNQVDTSLRAQNAETVASDYAAAQKATAQQLASRGGGNTLLPDSISANILAANTNAAAAQRAAGERQITSDSYKLGNQNWLNAAQLLGNTANMMNPNAYASESTGAGSAAGTTAYQIAQAANSPWTAAIGALGSVAGGALGGGGMASILSKFGRGAAGNAASIANWGSQQGIGATGGWGGA